MYVLLSEGNLKKKQIENKMIYMLNIEKFDNSNIIKYTLMSFNINTKWSYDTCILQGELQGFFQQIMIFVFHM